MTFFFFNEGKFFLWMKKYFPFFPPLLFLEIQWHNVDGLLSSFLERLAFDPRPRFSDVIDLVCRRENFFDLLGTGSFLDSLHFEQLQSHVRMYCTSSVMYGLPCTQYTTTNQKFVGPGKRIDTTTNIYTYPSLETLKHPQQVNPSDLLAKLFGGLNYKWYKMFSVLKHFEMFFLFIYFII